jgi:crotonobetaine/carnitine-CoA ligase
MAETIATENRALTGGRTQQKVVSTGTLPWLLRDRAAAAPQEVALIDASTGRGVTLEEFDRQAHTWARRMAAYGVVAGDRVMTVLGATFDAYYAWLGLSGLGAVEVPLNPQLKGRMLTYMLNHSESRLLITQQAFVENILSIKDTLDSLEQIVVLDMAAGGERTEGKLLLISGAEFAAREVTIEFYYAERHDTSCMIYTSGTTGAPKGVIVPWGRLGTALYRLPVRIREGGSRYSFLSPAHMSGKVQLDQAMSEHRALVLRETFSVKAFWEDVVRYDCRVAQLFPAMIKYLLGQPPSAGDRDTPLDYIWTAPVTSDTREFMQRFDVMVSTGFGMTEIGGPIAGVDIDGTNLKSCGRMKDDPRGYELRLVDEYDQEVEVGEVGELIVRTSAPWSMSTGYFRNPEATAAAWRNGWFHTGDALRQDSDGNFYFVDRFKDCIRRKGENISSFEVEEYVLEVPGVAEAAAIGVPSEDGEQEVKVFLVARPGESLNLAKVGDLLSRTMPRFMVPRFLEEVSSLPRTPATGRVQKRSLRAQPTGARTWDRLADSA